MLTTSARAVRADPPLVGVDERTGQIQGVSRIEALLAENGGQRDPQRRYADLNNTWHTEPPWMGHAACRRRGAMVRATAVDNAVWLQYGCVDCL